MDIRTLLRQMQALAQRAARGEDVRIRERELRWKFEQLSEHLSVFGDRLRDAIEDERCMAASGSIQKHMDAVRTTDSLINQISNFDQ